MSHLLRLSVCVLSCCVVAGVRTKQATAQELLLFEGTLRCMEAGAYRPASGTLVLPLVDSSRVMARTNSVGYYPFRLPKRPVIDRTMTIQFKGRDSTDVKRVFIGREDIGAFHNVRLPTVNSRHPCVHIEQGESVVEQAVPVLFNRQASNLNSVVVRWTSFFPTKA